MLPRRMSDERIESGLGSNRHFFSLPVISSAPPLPRSVSVIITRPTTSSDKKLLYNIA